MEKMNRLVNQLFKELENDCITDDGFRFPDMNGECEQYADFKEDTLEVLSDESPLGISFDILNSMSDWHLGYSQYVLIHEKSNQKSLEEFAKSTQYGYLATKKSDEAWGCLPSDEYHLMNLISLYFAQSIICGWNKESTDFLDIMIASIDFGIQADENDDPLYRIIEGGFNRVPASWFLLELSCIIGKRNFNRENANYPHSMKPYDEVLKIWNTTDLAEIDRLVHLLADAHLDQAQEENTDDDYFEFGNSNLWLFPYEILVWLKLREEQGLKNPTEFTHPLMNTPIAKIFLEIKEPLPKPKELPYAKELLEKLKETCPKIEIPEGL